MRKAEEFWDRLAKKYAKSPIKNMEAYNQTMERTKAYMSTSDTVMEVGCGTGSTALLLANSVKHITAGDISSNMIDVAKTKAKDQQINNITFVKGTLFDANLEKGPFDLVLAFNFLHLLEDLPSAIHKIREQLRPGGLVISKTVCMAEQFGLWRFLLPIMQMIGMAPHVNFLTIEGLEGYFKKEGFEIIETGNYPASPTSRFIVAKIM